LGKPFLIEEWEIFSPNTDTELRASSFVNADEGWVVGEYGIILKIGCPEVSSDFVPSTNVSAWAEAFPNPATNQIQVQNRGQARIQQVEWRHLSGQLISSNQVDIAPENSTTLPLPASLIGRQGMYFLVFRNDHGQSTTQKIVISN
jgi:hypothetical protein